MRPQKPEAEMSPDESPTSGTTTLVEWLPLILAVVGLLGLHWVRSRPYPLGLFSGPLDN